MVALKCGIVEEDVVVKDNGVAGGKDDATVPRAFGAVRQNAFPTGCPLPVDSIATMDQLYVDALACASVKHPGGADVVAFISREAGTVDFGSRRIGLIGRKYQLRL